VKAVAAGFLTLLLTASCSPADEPEKQPEKQPSTGLSAVPSSAAPPLQAADGTDAKACSDGRCQIVVTGQTDFALDGKFSCEGVIVTYRKPDQLNLIVAVVDRDSVNATITGTGKLRLAYGLTLTVETMSPAGAVLRVAPQKNDPRRHTGTGTQGFSLWSG